MARFKTGSKVEVFSTREVSSGSWYRAEIIHGNGHYYTVKYEMDKTSEFFDRVPRRAIRPCPPPMQVLDWVSGDVVEVFHQFSWKIATVLRALQTGWILVRLLGADEIEVSEFDARPRLFLHDGKWNVIGKGSSKLEQRQNVPSWNLEAATSNINGANKSLKRMFKSCYPESEANGSQNRKIRFRRKDRRKSHGKVAFACPRAMAVEKPMERGANSITSSVGSCSMSAMNHCEIPLNFLRGPYEENGDYYSDAESFCPKRSEEGKFILPTDQELSEEIHKIELHAYHSIIGALFASGPLSWEKETLLTDLRDSLHISNDEHLMELRSLVSSST